MFIIAMYGYDYLFQLFFQPLYNHPVSRVLDYRENDQKTHNSTPSNNVQLPESNKAALSNVFKFSQMSMDDFRLLSVLGRGHFGKVILEIYLMFD